MFHIDTIFKIIVYSICIYLIFIQNITINNIGYIILICHLYKDITNLKKWPLWTEPVSLIIAIILIKEGYFIHNNIIILMGIIMFIGHMRQLYYDNNKYYY